MGVLSDYIQKLSSVTMVVSADDISADPGAEKEVSSITMDSSDDDTSVDSVVGREISSNIFVQGQCNIR